VKDDGTLGSFRPADDMLEEAATLLVKPIAIPKDMDPSTTMSEKDLRYFSSLAFARSALKRVCDVKGNLYSIVHNLTPGLNSPQRSPLRSWYIVIHCQNLSNIFV
jgi:hypothetical protein